MKKWQRHWLGWAIVLAVLFVLAQWLPTFKPMASCQEQHIIASDRDGVWDDYLQFGHSNLDRVYFKLYRWEDDEVPNWKPYHREGLRTSSSTTRGYWSVHYHDLPLGSYQLRVYADEEKKQLLVVSELFTITNRPAKKEER